MLDKELATANKYWEAKETQVWHIAMQNDLDAALECIMESGNFDFDSFLFDLFDCGSYEATDEEILEAIIEAIEE